MSTPDLTPVDANVSSASIFRQYIGPFLAMVAAFTVYYAMYAIRKPFGAATWDGDFFGTSIELKTSLVISQTIGYALAKLIGTRICSGVKYWHVPFVLMGCVIFAMLALLGLPYAGDFKFVFMFLNGLGLGMIWGFVMRPLEGRIMTEMLIAGLCVSFIVASGDVKTAGKVLMESDGYLARFGDTEVWMPFLTALSYFPYLLVGCVVLFCLPRPTEVDKDQRSVRDSMNKEDRWGFLRHNMRMLIPLGIGYFLLTAYRDYRDSFQLEIFTNLGIEDASAFSSTERYVSLGVIAVLSIFIFIKKSRLALTVCHVVMASGLAFCGAATLLLKFEMLGGYHWMVAAGLGAYITYIAYHCIIFERLVAYTRSPGNAVFAMMVFDFVGYVASILFMLGSDLVQFKDKLGALVWLTWVLTIFGGGAILYSMFQIPRLQVFESEKT